MARVVAGAGGVERTWVLVSVAGPGRLGLQPKGAASSAANTALVGRDVREGRWIMGVRRGWPRLLRVRGASIRARFAYTVTSRKTTFYVHDRRRQAGAAPAFLSPGAARTLQAPRQVGRADLAGGRAARRARPARAPAPHPG